MGIPCWWTLQIFPNIYHNEGSLVAQVVESTCNAGNPGLITRSRRSPGEGNGYTLQYSCLENSMERGTWWATIYGVTKSQTQWSNWVTTFSFPYHNEKDTTWLLTGLYPKHFDLGVLRRFSSEVKVSACSAGDLGLIPGLKRSLGEKNGYTLQYSCLENSMNIGAWWTTVYGVAKSEAWRKD